MITEKKDFKVLKIVSQLPCGKKQLLVRHDFEAIEDNMKKIESDKWTDTDSNTGIPVDHLNLDYNLARQPGASIYYFLSLFIRYSD